MKTTITIALFAGILLFMPNLNFGQTAPTLGTLADFAFFTSEGAFTVMGDETVVTGDVGSFTDDVVGFPPGTLYGTKYMIANPVLLLAKEEAESVYADLQAMSDATVIDVQLGGLTLTPDLYTTGSGAAADLTGVLTLDALDDPNAIFIIQIDGALTSGAGASVVLANGAKWENVYWQVNGAVTLNRDVDFFGNIFANGAIIMLERASLKGRGISIEGAISLHNNNVSMANPSIELVKTGTYTDLDPLGLNPGDQVNYSFLVTNTGNVTLYNISIEDLDVSVTGDPLAELAPGASDNMTFTAVYVLTQEDIDNGSFTNTAEVTGTTLSGIDVTVMDTHVQEFEEQLLPSIRLEKDGTFVDLEPLGLNPGDQIMYSFEVTNTGNVTLYNIIIDDLDVSVTGGPLAELAPGDSDNETFTAVYILTQEDIDNGSFTNTAEVTGTTPSGFDVTGMDRHVQEFEEQLLPSIRLEKNGTYVDLEPLGLNPGDQIMYSFEVTNTGNVTLYNISIEDLDVSVTGGPLAELAPGDSDNMTFTAVYVLTQEDIDNGSFTNTAEVTGTTLSGFDVTGMDTHVQEFEEQLPSIALNKRADPLIYASVGDQITYTIEVENTGNVTLLEVLVTDPLTDFEVIIEVLDPGQLEVFTVFYIITEADMASGNVINIATATGHDAEDTIVIDDGEVIIIAELMPGLTLTKTANPQSFTDAGDVITYTIVVENTGGTTLNEVLVTDPLTDLEVIIESLLPGEQRTYIETYIISQADVDNGSVINIARAENEDVQAQDQEIIEAIPMPRLFVCKAALQETYSYVGEVIEYGFIVYNIGNVTIFDVEVTDPLLGLNDIIPVFGPGEWQMFSANYSITQEDLERGFVWNTATATGTGPNGEIVTDDDRVQITTDYNPGITVTKTASQQTYSFVGEQVTYTIRVENTGNQILSDVEVTDALLGLNETIEIMLPEQSALFTEIYVITQADINNREVLNIAMAKGQEPNGIDVEDSDSVLIQVEKNPELRVTKTANPQVYSSVGDQITYTILVENTGNQTITHIMVMDPMIGLERVIVSLAEGESSTITKSYLITREDLVRGSLLNVVMVTGIDADGEEVTAQDEALITADPNPELTVTKSALPEQVYAGNQVTYTILVSNNEMSDADNVVVTDILPVGTAFVSASNAGTYNQPANTVTWNIGNLPTNQSVTLYLVVGVNSDVAAGTVIPNIATADSDNSESPVQSNPALVTVIAQADLAIVKTASVNQAYEGDDVIYTLTVTNNGPSVAHNVLINDDLPTQVIFVSASHGGVYHQQTHSVQWQTAELAQGASLMRTINVRISTNVPANTSIINHSSVASDTYDNDLTNNQDSHQLISLGPKADIAVVKRVEQLPVYAGENYSYLVNVTNNGPSDAAGVTVTDKLPPGTSYVSADRNGVFNLASRTVTWEIDFLGIGQTETFMITLRVPSEISGGTILTNEVTAFSQTFDPDLTNNTFILNTPVTTPELFIPDVFTPNADGINDTWVIRGLDRYPNNKVVIINRWGNRVFEAAPYKNDWDGTNQFSPTVGGFELPTGTYFYILDTGDPDKGILRGTIFLSR